MLDNVTQWCNCTYMYNFEWSFEVLGRNTPSPVPLSLLRPTYLPLN